MDAYIEDAFGLVGILVLLPIMVFVVVPGTLFFDRDFGLFRR